LIKNQEDYLDRSINLASIESNFKNKLSPSLWVLDAAHASNRIRGFI
jgi:hypothetical protein